VNVNSSNTFWKSRPVFVTGATGLLGGWLVKELTDLDADVIALVRDGSPRSMAAQTGLLDRITVVRGSVEDFDVIRRALSEYSVATVFHLAAQPLVGVAKLNPIGTLEANVAGTWNVLEAARQAGPCQVIMASSDKAYGASEQLPYQETHALRGRFPYDVSKSCADLICGMYAATYSLPVVVMRCANLFGGGDLNFSRLLPDLIRSTLRGEQFVIRSDGKFVRDFLYVKDAAAGYLCAAQRVERDHSLAGEAFNLSLELRLSVIDFVQTVLRTMGREDLRPIVQNAASSEIREQYLDSQKARRTLSWSPQYTLEEGLKETITWYKEFLDLGTRDTSALNERQLFIGAS
jgi:CDP-glucose 4,6-dehydratase